MLLPSLSSLRRRGWLLPLGISALFALALGLTACRRQSPTRSAPLRLGIDLWAGYYPAVIASEQKFFAEENVEVDLQVPQDTRRMMADFAARSYDAICVSIGDMILLSSKQGGLRMILCSDESAGGDALFARQPIQSAADLRGKRIGTNLGGFGELLVRRFLQSRGVRPEEVQIVTVDASQALTQIQAGQLDVAHTWEPYASQLRGAGFREVYSSRDTPGLVLDGLVIHEQLLRDRPAEIRAFQRAWFRAVDWWKAHPEEGNALVEKRLKLDRGSVSLQGIRLMAQADNRMLFAAGGKPGTLEATLSEFVEFFVSRGLLSRRLTAAEFLDANYLP